MNLTAYDKKSNFNLKVKILIVLIFNQKYFHLSFSYKNKLYLKWLASEVALLLAQ